MPEDNLKRYPTNLEAITDLQNGNLDCMIIDAWAAQGYASLRPIKTILTIETNENYGIAMPKGCKMNAQISKALQDIINSGEMISIVQNHIK